MVRFDFDENGKIVRFGDPAIKSSYSDGSGLFWNDTTKRVEEDPTYFVYSKTTHSLGLGGTSASDTRFHIKGTTTSHIARLDTGLDFKLVTPPGAISLVALLTTGNVDIGNHYYRCSFVTAIGETELNTGDPYSYVVTTDATHRQVQVTIPVSSDYRVTSVNIYRASTNQDYYVVVKKVGSVANGVTTFVDNIADASRTGNDNFARANTTNRFITVNGSPSAFISAQSTTFGYRAGEGSLLGTTGGGENSLFGASVGISTYGSKNSAFGIFINVGSSDSSVLLGHGAGGVGANFQYCIIAGRNVAFWNTYSSSSVILGGAKGTTYYTAHYLTSIGMDALNSIATGAGNLVAIGTAAGANITTAVGCFIAGAFVNAPSATASGQINVLNVLFGVGGYATSVSSAVPTSGGCLGVAIVPGGNARLELAAGKTTIAPFKLTSSGTGITGLLTTAVKGMVEFSDYGLWFTPSTIRHKVWEGLVAATAPTTNLIGVIVDYYGTSATRVLTTPDTWATITGDDGATYKIPAYL